jgi:hypothetical protein
MSDVLVNPEDMSKDTLFSLFESAYFSEVGRDSDNDILVRVSDTSFPFYVLPSEDGRRIQFRSANLPAKPGVLEDTLLRLANSINRDLVIVRASVFERKEGLALYLDWYVSVEGGVSKRAIVMAVKLFSDVLVAAIRKDEEDVLK